MKGSTKTDLFNVFMMAAVLFAALLMHGCSAAAPDPAVPVQTTDNRLQDFLAKIQDVTVTDAQAALADVHAHGDVDLAALSCYPALIDFVQSSPLQPTAPTVKGVLSVNQLKRDVLLGGIDRSGPFAMAFRKLHVACAAYAGDEARFAAEFAAMIGSKGATGMGGLPLVIGPAIPASSLAH